jgi:chitodextrinase
MGLNGLPMRRTDLVIFVLLFAFSCKKREYPVSMEKASPEVFYFNGTIDGKPIDLRAGDSTYYLYTAYERDTNNVLNFSGELRSATCGSCERIRIQLNDGVANATTAGDSAISARSYGFIPVFIRSPKTEFAAAFNGTASTYQWDFGDGTGSSESRPSHAYTKPGTYDVCLTVTGENKCMNTVCNSIVVLADGSSFAAAIGVEFTGDQSVKFSAAGTGGKSPYRFLWNFGDGGTSRDPQATHNYMWKGSYPVKLTVTDADGRTVTANYNLVTRNDKSACAANFSVSSSGLENLSLSKVRLSYTDDSNVTYRSDGLDQPSESYFIITGVEDFGKNERGEETKLLNVKFRAVLSSPTKQVNFTSEGSVWSVAVP